MVNSGIDHESTELISQAALWLATTPKHSRPHSSVVEIRKRFGLTSLEAISAIREADLIKARAA
ncbi:hypothetical protein [Mesorhizobium sp. dw_380]|uniref:hypothetical protein n=1 Tax=Mesorhizobium sp. dw_380 TaxID=2812001 RepID=UPI001BDEDD69|nr:hypothetical protein [Mesorhizobium sp. dw_380]